MESIQKNLQDPSWWFSAVFIAIIAGVFAAFAKDWVERRYGLFLRWSATKREQLRLERVELIAKWSSSEGLLTLAILQMLVHLILSCTLAIATLVYVIYLRLKFHWPVALIAETLPIEHLVGLVIGVLALSFVGFYTGRVFFVTCDAISAFRKSRALPPYFE